MLSVLVYLVTWWLVFFAVLPFGVKPNPNPTRDEYHGAPINPDLKKKAIITSLLSIPVTALFMVIWNP